VAGDYSFGTQMGGDDPESDTLGKLLTYGANTDEETTGQPGGAPNPISDASAPIAPAAHVAAVAGQQPATPTAAPVAPPSQASQAPVAPVVDRDPQEALYAQKAADEKVSNVAPKWWERGLGALTAGAMAFGHVPGAVEAGQAVTNRGQNAAELQRQGRLKADDVGIQAWEDGQKAQQQNFQNQHEAFDDQDRATSRAQMNSDRAAQESQRLQAVAPGSEAPDDPKNPLGTWHATSVGGKPIALQGPPDKWAKSPAGIAAQRDADVERLKLTGDDAKYYRANGKLKEPGAVTNVHVPSEGQQAYNDALTAWRTDNPGKKPTLNDLRTIRSAADGKAEVTGGPKRGTAGQFSTLDKETETQYAKAEAEYKTAADAADNDNDRASALATLNAEKARIGAGHSQRLRDLGGVPAEDSQTGSTSKTYTPDQIAKAKKYLDAAGGDKAKARAAAAKDGVTF
jgi:hypothetical protein